MIASAVLPWVQDMQGREANTKSNRIRVWAGFIYLVVSLSCTVWYVLFLAPTLTNDLYWPHYNTTGYQVFLIDLLNVKLQTASHDDSVNLLSIDATMLKSYASSAVQPDFYNNYARRVLLSELNTLEKGIQGTRNTPKARMASLSAQYCWVDFNRRWDIAHTDARSQRCRQRYQDNAANYLEFLVRNVDWGEFLAANSDSWPVVIGLALQSTAEGIQWLADRPMHSLALAVEAEVAFLVALHLTRYELQWQNDIQMGLVESIVMENALHATQNVLLKTMDHTWAPWTSIIMYWNFRNDLGGLNACNVSLVRGAANYFQTVGGSDFFALQLGFTLDWLVAQSGAFTNTVGPFGSVDLLYIQVPPSLTRIYAYIVSQMMHSTVGADNMLPDFQLTPLPPTFYQPGLVFYGGNLICVSKRPTSFPQSLLAFDDACTDVTRLTIAASGTARLFALVVSMASDMASICSYQETIGCVPALIQTQAVLQSMDVMVQHIILDQAVAALPAIQLVQYAQDDTDTWHILQQPLLTPDPTWSFYGWLLLFDWLEGRREVVSFEGDLSTVVVMSDVVKTYHVAMGGSNGNAQSGPQAIYYLTVYTTCVMLAVGLAILVCVARHRYAIYGHNLLMFHRVAAFVWIGRPLLLLRGLTAVVVLCTPRTLLTQSGSTSLVATHLSGWETFVVAGEATWVVYVVHDMWLVVDTSVKYKAFLASGLAWAASVLYILLVPPTLTATIDRQCRTTTAHEYLFCESGGVSLGHWSHVSILGLIDAVAIVLAHLVVRWVARDSHTRAPAPWQIHGTAQAYFDGRTWSGHRHAWELDAAASIMSGSLPFHVAGHKYAFDVTLWVVQESRREGTLPESTPAHVVHPESKRWSRYVSLGLGVAYLGLTAAGSVSYIALSQINLANDFYWAMFNLTGHHIAIADWFNFQLALDAHATAIRLDDPKFNTMAIDFANPSLQISYSPWYGARLQLEVLNVLHAAIEGLRRTDGCAVPWIFTQYCWLDFNRQWPMANSQARQERCRSNGENGALFLEAVLRNIEWTEFNTCWGDAFDVAFRVDLEKSVAGLEWLGQMQRPTISVDDEVSHWMASGVSHYTVQWQNFKLPGLINTYEIENAFGAQYPMTLSHSNGSFRLALQSSYKMYWGLASDLWAVDTNQTFISGLSLIRTSADFAFANASMLTVLAHNMTLNVPLGEAFHLVQTLVGPFGSIDMKAIMCPASVQQLLRAGVASIRTTYSDNVSAANDYRAIGPAILNVHFALPSTFLAISDWLAYGGNILCPEIGPTSVMYGLYQFTGRLIPCDQWLATELAPTKDNVLIAALSAGLTQSTDHLQSVCAHDTAPDLCLDEFLGPSVHFLETFTHDIEHVEGLAVAAVLDVRSIQPSMTQYVRENESQPLHLLTFALLDPSDPTFDFWSWLHVFEWATANREVIEFQGDAGSLHLLTEWTPPQSQQVQSSELPTTFTYYALGGALYITGMLLVLSSVVLIYALTSRLHIDASNLFKLNRVAGMVWIGRPLLLLRSVTALCLLSTATLTLEIENHVSGFRVPTLPWYKAILGAGETTWLVYIANDIGAIWTKEYTTAYASHHSLLVWCVAAVITLFQPVVYDATIQPMCQIDQMDFQLVCVSGVLRIGHVTRIYTLVGIVGGCHVITLVAARLNFRRRKPPPTTQFQHLSSGAKYFLNQTRWLHQDVYYIDPASAVLSGLVVVPWGDVVHFVDVKLWRSYSIPAAPSDAPPRLYRSLPLTE
ncbi:Aste57867_8690 [Aphanomyces stellatus]|uniref:Aste57867_8690 protein n=1 Tax=Aphanomyces stellatus TaxID=120398 RepID=A0A485KL03_9STRA|nr:hypothetical protein As57867_008656 [Aphanomyces stellatus]VFT85576.1 Aste57867_8690 [Aphanomyces stellatus]